MFRAPRAPAEMETCPRCGCAFPARPHRDHPNAIVEVFTLKGLLTKINDSARVACPTCQHHFSGEHVRFFGILSLRQARLMFVAYILGLVALAIGFGIAIR